MHSLKADSLIDIIEEGIDISLSDEHCSKTQFPIVVTVEGIEIFLSDLHLQKA